MTSETLEDYRKTVEELNRTIRAQSRHTRDLAADNRALRTRLKEVQGTGGRAVVTLEAMRRAFLDALDGRAEEAAKRREKEQAARADHRKVQEVRLFMYLQEHEASPPEYLRSADLAAAMRCSSGVAGQIVQDLFPVSPSGNGKGYASDVIYRELATLLQKGVSDGGV